MTPAQVDWEEFSRSLAELAPHPPGEIEPETRLVKDLDLDSLALIELVVAMVDQYGLAIPDGLDADRWADLTAGQLFEAVGRGVLN